MEREFVPLTCKQVDAAIRGELKLETRSYQDVKNVKLTGNVLETEIHGEYRSYEPSGRYLCNRYHNLDLFVAELTPTTKTVKVNETVMGLKEALIFISNMITEQ